MKTRRELLSAAAALLLAPAWVAAQGAKVAPLIEVWKSPTCGCCKDWMRHLEAHGFKTKTHDSGNNAVRARLGIDMQYASCHTALVGGYAIEGHVPAREILRLLAERPQALGLAVPAMPIGSPGMDGPEYGGQRDAYAVLLLAKGGASSVYQAYR